MNLATEKQSVLYFMAELQKAKNAAWMAREATKVAVKASYEQNLSHACILRPDDLGKLTH